MVGERFLLARQHGLPRQVSLTEHPLINSRLLPLANRLSCEVSDFFVRSESQLIGLKVCLSLHSIPRRAMKVRARKSKSTSMTRLANLKCLIKGVLSYNEAIRRGLVNYLVSSHQR